MDQSKKTMRHFYCRDVLWETFEQMANDFDCSIDYLVNEAMRAYARSKNYQAGSSSSASLPALPAGAGANGSLAPAAPSTPPPGRVSRPPVITPVPPPEPRRPAATLPPSSPPPPPRRNNPTPVPPPPPKPAPAPAADTAGATLYLMFNQQRHAIDKDQFIIGRGSKTADLAIKDGNISRKHAAVISRNGMFYIKDLGSTNGIDYKGMRIDNKRIDEGDIFHICDYELKFTYR